MITNPQEGSARNTFNIRPDRGAVVESGVVRESKVKDLIPCFPRRTAMAASHTPSHFRTHCCANCAGAISRSRRYGVSSRISNLKPTTRNRCILSAFRARTSRNQPSNTAFIFGPSTWLRFLIKPPAGYGIAYIDFAAQEFGIAAALSGDPNKINAYKSGDVYIAFGKQSGKLPPDATAKTHASARHLFKQCVLGIGYSMGEVTLAQRIGQPPIVARDMLRAHRETYTKFWAWSDAAVDHAMLRGSLHTTFGWLIHVDEHTNPRSLRNFPMQANAAEMLRLSCIFATERGVEVCAPVHDALLICAPLDRLEADIATTRAAMAEASRLVLGGFEIRTDVKVVRYPDRYTDPRGMTMWQRIMALIGERPAKVAAA